MEDDRKVSNRCIDSSGGNWRGRLQGRREHLTAVSVQIHTRGHCRGDSRKIWFVDCSLNHHLGRIENPHQRHTRKHSISNLGRTHVSHTPCDLVRHHTVLRSFDDKFVEIVPETLEGYLLPCKFQLENPDRSIFRLDP